MQPEVNSMNLSEWVMLIVLSILWGGSFFFVGVAVNALPPLTIVSLRVALASLTLLAVVFFSGLRLPLRREIWTAFLGMSLLNNVIPFSLIVWGQTHIASGLAAILNATTPLFTVIAAHIWTCDEKMSPMKMFGVIIGFAGAVIMMGSEALAGIGGTIYGQFAKQIGIYLVSWVLFTRFGLRIYGPQSHLSHQPLNTLTIDFIAQPLKKSTH